MTSEGCSQTGGPRPAEEIRAALDESLRQDVGGTRGLAWHAPSTGDLCKLCMQADQQGDVPSAGPAPLTGTAMREARLAQDQPQNPAQDQRAFVEQIGILWDAWRAWPWENRSYLWRDASASPAR
jgi:hypothetical protein